jgi:hypothetical protein
MIALADADKQAKAVVEMETQLDPASIPARAISVLPFEADPADSVLYRLSFALADILAADLSASPRLQLVERRFMSAIVREINMGQQGAVDARTAPRVGRLIGAWRTVIGTLNRAGDTSSLAISSRIVEVVNGRVLDAVNATSPLARILDAEKALAFRLFEEMNITLTPAQRARVEQRQTTNLSALVAYGRGLEAEAKGDVAAATEAFREAARIDPGFEAARAHASAGAATAAPRIARVLDNATQVINSVATTRVADVVDTPAQVAVSGAAFTLLLTIRVF